MLPINVWRHGKDEELPPRQELRAGPLSMTFELGELRSIRLGESEVINRIYAAVRDRNWDTAPPVISRLHIDAGEDTFRVSFDVDCTLREISFLWKGAITGNAAGTIVFSMEGVARSTFLKNRIGFCILHPDSCAGAACVLAHTDGSEERSVFPTAISPHQPFLDMRGITHKVLPGVWAELEFDGDAFETEDQRNWTDASYKTYCTPLSQPFPARVEKGSTVSQAVTLRLKARAGSRLQPETASARKGPQLSTFDISPASSVGPLPVLGLCVASHGMDLSEREIGLIRTLRPDHLRVDLDLADRDFPRILDRAFREAASLGAGLHAGIHLSEAAEMELNALQALLEGARSPDLWLVFRKGEPCTADRWVEMARRILGPAVPSAKFASGTNAYFTELNRGTPPGPAADCIVYSINPQIHAFDDLSLMETLSAQATTVRCARRISGGRPVAVSPVTLKARFNAVATGPIPPVPPGELPPQVDPRQMSLFAAAWTLGSFASLSAAGAAVTTWYETTGWRGVMETEPGPPVPQKFPPLPGCVFPLYHVLADIGEFRGGQVLGGTPRYPRKIVGITILCSGKRRTLIANLDLAAQVVVVKGLPSRRALVRCLDESTVEQACRSPDEFRISHGSVAPTPGGELEMKLLPYAVARIDWED
jgi:hypothetical protein